MASEAPTHLRMRSIPKNRSGALIASRMDATTTHPTLINRVINNQMLFQCNMDFALQGSKAWSGVGLKYIGGYQNSGSGCDSGSAGGTLARNVFHSCGNGNALHWQPNGRATFAIDFNGANNKGSDDIFGQFGDEILGKGSIIQLLFGFPKVTDLAVVKQSSVPINTLASVGEEITYTYKIANTGCTSIHNVQMSDDHRSNGTFVGPNIETATLEDNTPLGDSANSTSNSAYDVLGPGDILTVTVTYTVTEADTALAN